MDEIQRQEQAYAVYLRMTYSLNPVSFEIFKEIWATSDDEWKEYFTDGLRG